MDSSLIISIVITAVVTGIVTFHATSRKMRDKVAYMLDALEDKELNFRFDESRVPAKMSEQPNRLKQAPDGSAHDIITAELKKRNLNPDSLSVKDKINLLHELDSKGVFLIKGAVKDAAAIFGCSQATMYRHLSRIKEF